MNVMKLIRGDGAKPVKIKSTGKNKLKRDEFAYDWRSIPEMADSTYALYMQQMVAFKEEINAVKKGEYKTDYKGNTVVTGETGKRYEVNRKIELIKEKMSTLFARCEEQPELIDTLDAILDFDLLPRVEKEQTG